MSRYYAGYRRPRSGGADHPPTARQIAFVKDLGGDEAKVRAMESWRDASDYIDELKKSPPKAGGPSPLLASSRQLEYIEKLGGDIVKAYKMTRKDASDYIAELRAKRPVPVEPPVTEEEEPAALSTIKSVDPRLALLNGLLENVRDGYYAVRADETDPMRFLRISRPKTGKYAGSLKIQSRHSEALRDAVVIYRSTDWYFTTAHPWTNNEIIESLMLLVVDPVSAGQRYAKEIGHCARCNLKLTDDRSRYYGIGPDCEKIWTHWIDRVDEVHEGHSYEWLHARSMA